MASSTRPKRNNSPINSKLQPLKATVPFQSLLTNPNPSNKSRTSPCSPVQVQVFTPDKRNCLRSPDIHGNEHRSLLSPLGSKVPVTKSKCEKHIRRTNSLETLSSSYINGQWPRESAFLNVNIGTTCTPVSFEDPILEDAVHLSLDQRQSLSLGGAGSKEIFRQHLQRTKKQSSPHHVKQLCVQGDHSAVSLSSKPVSIPQAPSSPKHPSLHTRRSVEGLNFELEGLDLAARECFGFGCTPPEGHRPPVPGICTKDVDMHTQTCNDRIQTLFSPNKSMHENRSLSLSPLWSLSKNENTFPRRSLSAGTTGIEIDLTKGNPSSLLKHAASPKPNNSFWFSRGPPDGAEKIPLSVEDKESDATVTSSCPDTSKVTIQFSKDSPFCSFAEHPAKTKKFLD